MNARHSTRRGIRVSNLLNNEVLPDLTIHAMEQVENGMP